MGRETLTKTASCRQTSTFSCIARRRTTRGPTIRCLQPRVRAASTAPTHGSERRIPPASTRAPRPRAGAGGMRRRWGKSGRILHVPHGHRPKPMRCAAPGGAGNGVLGPGHRRQHPRVPRRVAVHPPTSPGAAASASAADSARCGVVRRQPFEGHIDAWMQMADTEAQQEAQIAHYKDVFNQMDLNSECRALRG